MKTDQEIRNPKSEDRKKPDIRRPKPDALNPFGRCHGRDIRGGTEGKVEAGRTARAQSAFGTRASFGLRISAFGIGLLALVTIGIPAVNAASTNLTFKAELSFKETYDSNVYLQDEDPNLTLVPQAARPFQDSFVTAVTPRVGLDYRVHEAFGLSAAYAPDVVVYHAEPSEDYVAHRGTLNLGGKVAGLPWEQANTFLGVSGSEEGLYFGGPGGAPAIGGIPLRERRAQFMYRGGFKATWTLGRFFLRPVASAYVHDFFTYQYDSRLPQYRGYENYVDRNDVQGGLDVGYRLGKNTRAFAGYRYGFQDEGPLITEPYQYDNQYHRLLFGVEGQPAPWVKLGVALGPDFHHSTDLTAPGFRVDYDVLFVDGTASFLPTKADTVALLAKQYTQPAFASCSIYEDTTYDLTYRHKFGDRWSAGTGFRAYIGDWLAPVNREDWIYTASTGVSYKHDRHWSADLGYSYDWVDSKVPNTEGREFTRHLVWLGARYTFR